MKNKIVLLIDNILLLDKAKEVGITTFLFPVKDYTVGYLNTFNIDEIKEDAYLLINRNLTNKDIDNLKKLIINLPSNIKGIVFEDLGLINILKDTNLEKIYNAKHLNCSIPSINKMLEYVDKVILSTDLTEEEINNIIDNTNNIWLYTLGLNQVMYSRRTLLSNYAKEYSLKKDNNLDIYESISDNLFKVVENDYGTVFYTGKYYNATRFLNNNKINSFIINLSYLPLEDSIKIINNIANNIDLLADVNIKVSSYNLDKETYYKLPPKEGDKNE